MPGCAEQDCGDRVGRGRGRAHAQQQREGRRCVYVVGKGQQQRQAGNPADSRQDAQSKAHAHAAEQIEHADGIKNNEQGIACGMQHVHFHERPSPPASEHWPPSTSLQPRYEKIHGQANGEKATLIEKITMIATCVRYGGTAPR
jgi:hypothetical protein